MKQVSVDILLEHYVLVDGAPTESGNAVVCAHFQPALDEGEDVSQVFWRADDAWWVGPMLGIEAVSMVYDRLRSMAVVLGRNGELVRVRDSSVLEEMPVDPISASSPFRRLRFVTSDLLALGGVRSVFQVNEHDARLVTRGNVAPLLFDSEDEILAQVIGDSDIWFDMDGENVEDFIAVGSGGSIGIIAGSELAFADSSTNVPFYSVCRRSKDNYVCGGRGGRLFAGGGLDNWGEYAVITGATDICSIVEFKGRLFACDGQGVFVQSGAGEPFEPNFLGQKSKVPAHSLQVSNESLISIAGKEAFITADGIHWTSLLG